MLEKQRQRDQEEKAAKSTHDAEVAAAVVVKKKAKPKEIEGGKPIPANELDSYFGGEQQKEG